MLKFTAITRCNKTHPNSNIIILYRNHCLVFYLYYVICTVRWYTTISVGNMSTRSLKSVEVFKQRQK